MPKGMRPARVLAPIFTSDDPRAIRFSIMALHGGLIGLMLEDIAWLANYPQTPGIYASGVKYVPEHPAFDKKTLGEDWKTIPQLIVDGYGDCEDLAAWRAAELRVRGIPAIPIVKVRRLPNGGPWRAHAVVSIGGKIEDPSAKLGMYNYSAALSR